MKTRVHLLLLIAASLCAPPATPSQSRHRRAGQPSPPATAPAPPAGPKSETGGEPSPPAAAAVAEEVGEDEVVRVETTLVTIPVSVMDRDGRFIPDLNKEDFRVYEDGVEQEVAYFAPVEKPFTVVLMLDTSASTWSKLGQIRDAAVAFLDQLRADDRVMVVSFARGLTVVSEPTSDREALRKAIKGIGKGLSTHLYDAVEKVMRKHLKRFDGRKAVVLFTDGVDATSSHATYESNVRDAEELDALVYPVRYDTSDGHSAAATGAPPPRSSRLPSILRRFPFPFPVPTQGGGGGGGTAAGSSRADYERGREYLREMAEKTGGKVYEANEDKSSMAEAFRNIAEELRRQYSLGYYPRVRGGAGRRRRIRVRVARPDLVVRARDGYIHNPTTGAGEKPASTAAQDKERPSAPPVLKKPLVASRAPAGGRL